MTEDGNVNIRQEVNRQEVQPYSEDYYSHRKVGALLSAEVVVPLVLKLAEPSSVIDVGCGTGQWLAVFRENGVEEIWGVDGAYISKKLLTIPEERFIPANLEQPLHLHRKFDLVVSLEVAEHLSCTYAETFINTLTELGPLILFSAGIPYQGGTHHLNEQWPEYWAKLFKDRGYLVVDPLRRKVWNSREVDEWYAQNMLIFVAQERLGDYPLLRKEYELNNTPMLSIVHPTLYMNKIEGLTQPQLRNALVRKAIDTLPYSIYRLLRNTYRLLLRFEAVRKGLW